MNKILLVMTLLAAGGIDASAQMTPKTGKLGLGLELGEQNGGAVKYWLTNEQALAGGLGVTSSGDLGAHAEYMWTAWKLLPQPPKGELGVHAAFGFRVRDDEFGLRPTAGLDYWLPGYPTELFFDAGPVFRLSPEQTVDFTALVGVRFYFTPGGAK